MFFTLVDFSFMKKFSIFFAHDSSTRLDKKEEKLPARTHKNLAIDFLPHSFSKNKMFWDYLATISLLWEN